MSTFNIKSGKEKFVLEGKNFSGLHFYSILRENYRYSALKIRSFLGGMQAVFRGTVTFGHFGDVTERFFYARYY